MLLTVEGRVRLDGTRENALRPPPCLKSVTTTGFTAGPPVFKGLLGFGLYTEKVFSSVSVHFVPEEVSLEVKIGYTFLEESSWRSAGLVGFVLLTNTLCGVGCAREGAGGSFGGGGLAGGFLLTVVAGCVPRSTSFLSASVLTTGLYLMGFEVPPSFACNRRF